MSATREAVGLVLRIMALTIILFLCYTLASIVVVLPTPGAAEPAMSPTDAPASPVEAGSVAAALLMASFLQAAVLTAIILRSRWRGWKLVGAVWLACYGLSTVVSQVESLIYPPHQLPSGLVPRLFVLGAVVAGLFSPLAVVVWGRLRPTPGPPVPNGRLVMSPGAWAWKLAAVVVAYLTLYFTFGYFVAWQNPAVQAYYGGVDPGSFFAQLAWIWETTPWMFPFQAARALLWAAFALPVIRMLQGPSCEVALLVASLFAVWSSTLLLPNPYMPAAVARAHLVEAAASNLIFGGLVGWLLSR